MNATTIETNRLSTSSQEGDFVKFRADGHDLAGTVKSMVISFFFGGSYAVVALDAESKAKVGGFDLFQVLIYPDGAVG